MVALGILEGRVASGVIQVLAVGERPGITPAQWQVWTVTGTSIRWPFPGCMSGRWRLWRLIGPLGVAALAAVDPALASAQGRGGGGTHRVDGLSALGGLSMPSQRTLIMIAIVMDSVVLNRQTRTVRTLTLALLLVLIRDPLAVLETGCWLSFAGWR